MFGDFFGDYMNYIVYILLIFDNQLMDSLLVVVKVEEQYVLNLLFIGGFNSVIWVYLMDKMIDMEGGQLDCVVCGVGKCQMLVCDGMVMKDDRGNDMFFCECRYLIELFD